MKYLALALLFFAPIFSLVAQVDAVSISGMIIDQQKKEVLPYVSVVLKSAKDSAFVTGVLSDDEGRFTLTQVKPGNYYLEIFYLAYKVKKQSVYVGSLSAFLDLSKIEMEEDAQTLAEMEIITKQDEVSSKMDKKSFDVADNLSQSGGSVLQTMQNLPGVSVQDGKVQLRGNDKVAVLIDGKQTALTGFGNQSALDNIPASAIERIEIINNPSSKYDANGNAGIINIIYKKNKQDGFSGKAGIGAGIGALWVRKENLPTVSPQYQNTPKINPSLSLNYRKKKINIFLQSDDLYTQTLNKNEFVTRTYDDGTIIHQQLKRNRNTNYLTAKAGLDWNMNESNIFSISGLFGTEHILDNGDQPFFNNDYSERVRMWQFLEDEIKTTVMASMSYQHKFKQAGHILNIGYNYTFHREDEKYYFTNTMPTYTGEDSFKLLSDEQVRDLTLDYIKPLKYGRLETGIKLRQRDIPTNMQFYPGLNSPLDSSAGGWANYKELIPAVYGNYIYETKKMEAELGLRAEYVDVKYEVNPNHPTYKSNGYNYTQPFPSLRLAYKLNDLNKISFFYNRRVDRPNEVDIRIFPKYDDAEIIKVGNPALKPQFTNSFELAYKSSWTKGYFYSAAYHRITDGTITRIASTYGNSKLIYAIYQNAGLSYNTGLEFVLSQKVNNWYSFNMNLNVYHNQINAFTVDNKYPAPNTVSVAQQEIISGNVKLNNSILLPKDYKAQVTIVYLAPDIIPQGTIAQRFSLDLGIKKTIQKGKGEVYLNATDLFNTLIISKQIYGDGFNFVSTDYYETQVIRIGYTYKF